MQKMYQKMICISGQINSKMMSVLKSLLLIVALSALGCSLRIGEDTSSMNITSFSSGCLNGINKKIELYMEGSLDVEQINQVFNCAKTALVLFKDRVRGHKKGEFTPQELRKFIQDLFLQDQVISNILLTQLVHLKKVIIGGSGDKLTISDIERFITFLDVLKKEVVFFQPYIRALNMSNKQEMEQDDNLLNKIKIEEDLKKSISRVSIFIKRFSNPYRLEDMKALVRELSLFFNPQHDMVLLDERIQLIGVLKQFMVGGSTEVIEPQEWESFLIGSSYLVSMWVNYLFLQKQQLFISPDGMRYIAMILKDSLDFLSLSVKNHPESRIGETEFLKVADHFKQAGIMTQNLKAKATKNIFLILLGKIFNTQKSRYGTIEFTPEQLKKIYKAIQPWIGIQAFLDDISRGNSFQENINKFSKLASFFPSTESFQEGQHLMEQMFLLKPLYRTGPKIYLSGEFYSKTKLKTDYKNMTIYNFFHFIAMMMRMGYEKDYPASTGMTSKELGDFFSDFQVIGENLGLFQKVKNQYALQPGEPEFIAANILTPSTKGFDHNWRNEEYVTANEVVEYLSYAFSFGFSLVEIDKELFQLCGKDIDESDMSEWDVERYDLACVRLHLSGLLKKYMDNMPDLQTVMAEMNKEQTQDLIEALIEISYETEAEYQSADSWTKSHLKNAIMAVYFVETTINRYDANKDLMLQDEETMSAFPAFKGYLSRSLVYMHCQSSDVLVEAVYAYTVAKKQLPASDSLKWYENIFSWMQLQTFKWWNWDLHLDRTKLTRVYSVIVKGFLAQRHTQDKNPDIKKCPDKSQEEQVYDDMNFAP